MSLKAYIYNKINVLTLQITLPLGDLKTSFFFVSIICAVMGIFRVLIFKLMQHHPRKCILIRHHNILAAQLFQRLARIRQHSVVLLFGFAL